RHAVLEAVAAARGAPHVAGAHGRAGAPPAHSLGQLLRARRHQPERGAAVPRAGGGALPARARARAPEAHEPFEAVLGTRRALRAGLRASRSHARQRLGRGAALGARPRLTRAAAARVGELIRLARFDDVTLLV